MTAPHVKYFVATGTWNYATIGFIFPANGGVPVVRTITAYDINGTIANTFDVTAYGDWGLTFSNKTNFAQPLLVISIVVLV